MFESQNNSSQQKQMKAPITRIILALIVLGLAGAGVAYFMYNKPHADLTAGQAAYTLSAAELMAHFELNEAAANEKYLDQVLEVTGTVAENTATADGGRVVLLREADALTGVSCAFLPEAAAGVADATPGTNLTLRGVCAGMLMDVNLSRCIVVN